LQSGGAAAAIAGRRVKTTAAARAGSTAVKSALAPQEKGADEA